MGKWWNLNSSITHQWSGLWALLLTPLFPTLLHGTYIKNFFTQTEKRHLCMMNRVLVNIGGIYRYVLTNFILYLAHTASQSRLPNFPRWWLLQFLPMPTKLGQTPLFPFKPLISPRHHHDIISTHDITFTSLWPHLLPMISFHSTMTSSLEHYKYALIT